MSEIKGYSVIINRRDREPLILLETEDFEIAHKSWKSMTEQWAICLHEQKPFEVTSPIVTAFDPGFIAEIFIAPFSVKSANNTNNPYQKEMVNKGFSNTFRTYTGSDLTDNGYK